MVKALNVAAGSVIPVLRIACTEASVKLSKGSRRTVGAALSAGAAILKDIAKRRGRSCELNMVVKLDVLYVYV